MILLSLLGAHWNIRICSGSCDIAVTLVAITLWICGDSWIGVTVTLWNGRICGGRCDVTVAIRNNRICGGSWMTGVSDVVTLWANRRIWIWLWSADRRCFVTSCYG